MPRKNPDSHREEMRRWVREYKVRKGCQECGERHPATLDLHHPDPSLKTMGISHGCKVWGLARIKKEVAQCVVLCSNCHRILHWNEQN